MQAQTPSPATANAASAATQLLHGLSDLGTTSVPLERQAVRAGLGAAFTRKPPRLLSDFSFPPGLYAVELGCGAGAITRLLGERCAQVHALAADNTALALTRERTRDQAQVAVLPLTTNRPVTEVPADLLVCSDSHVDHNGHLQAPGKLELGACTPYLLKADGNLIAAASLTQAGTDGLAKLRARLAQHYARVALYFPFPDHHRPDCLLAETFFERVDARELVSRYATDDAQRRRIAQSASVSLSDCAHSVLIVADNGRGSGLNFPQIGVMYGRRRPAAPNLETRTKFLAAGPSDVRTHKTHLGATATSRCGRLIHRDCADPWVAGSSMLETLLRRACEPDRSLTDIFRPAHTWLQALRQQASLSDGSLWLPGYYLDATWQNAFIDAGLCRFIDLEWRWHQPIPLSTVLIRSMTYLLDAAEQRSAVDARLRPTSRKRLMRAIAATLGVTLTRSDFHAYQHIDAAFYVILEGGNARHTRIYNRIKLRNQALFSLVTTARNIPTRIVAGLRPGNGHTSRCRFPLYKHTHYQRRSP